ncbi:MAG: tetratricopeptide repeat protein [Patescibacteria group bacterium]
MKPVEQIISDARAALNRGELGVAEKLFSLAAENSAAPDAWNGLGAIRFEQGNLEESARCFEKAKAMALESHGGVVPKRLEWNPENKPLLRALQGIGLNLFRAGRTAEARKSFQELLKINPEDNQGAQNLLDDLDAGKNPWKTGL